MELRLISSDPIYQEMNMLQTWLCIFHNPTLGHMGDMEQLEPWKLAELIEATERAQADLIDEVNWNKILQIPWGTES